ncbi:Protein CBG01206 [Caenorhabditis briggsae]|uniref:Protein CBG01206 n=1 Tax=Caenorhabditis briggsae TaxID=6238 RepID=B0K061_CAEBR|nr:Protein CBG01206 [Caenorhabditis briggsae]CAP22501.4 Protein CBG01206 [Caenorhabditis briggsae]
MIRILKWDASLATSAQKYTNNCPNVTSGTDGVGENMYWSWSSQAPSTNLDSFGVAASNSWEENFQDYGWTSILLDEVTFNSGIGSATQMAWAETNLVGCGGKNCGKDSTKNNMYKVQVVCQYKERGNSIGSNIYKQGEPCSACTSGSCDTSSGLCA